MMREVTIAQVQDAMKDMVVKTVVLGETSQNKYRRLTVICDLSQSDPLRYEVFHKVSGRMYEGSEETKSYVFLELENAIECYNATNW